MFNTGTYWFFIFIWVDIFWKLLVCILISKILWQLKKSTARLCYSENSPAVGWTTARPVGIWRRRCQVQWRNVVPTQRWRRPCQSRICEDIWEASGRASWHAGRGSAPARSPPIDPSTALDHRRPGSARERCWRGRRWCPACLRCSPFGLTTGGTSCGFIVVIIPSQLSCCKYKRWWFWFWSRVISVEILFQIYYKLIL